MAAPLAGLKVLDVSRLLPGPYASLVLADLGARVDKVEDPNGGESLRSQPPLKGTQSAYFRALNRNKRSLALSLRSPEGIAAFKRLVPHYDVLLESFRPGVMEAMGLGYAALSQLNPKLVYCSITGYGATGPKRDDPGHDLNYAARSGVLGYGGSPDGLPAMPGVQIADIGGGSLFALVGILSTLLEVQRTGKGRFIDISMTDGALAFLHLHLGARMELGPQGAPLERGTDLLNGGLPTYGLYRTKDGRTLAVASLEPKFFMKLSTLLAQPQLMELAYAGPEERAQARAALTAIFVSKTRDEWVSLLGGEGVCVEPVLEGDDVLHDANLRARGVFESTPDGDVLRTPLKLDRVPVTPSPELGADTETILREAGFSAAEIAAVKGA